MYSQFLEEVSAQEDYRGSWHYQNLTVRSGAVPSYDTHVDDTLYVYFVVVETSEFTPLGCFFTILWPSFVISLIAVVCEMKLRGLLVSTSRCSFVSRVWVSLQLSPGCVLLIMFLLVSVQLCLMRLIVLQSSIFSRM